MTASNQSASLPQIFVTPGRGLIDEPVAIQLSGFEPNRLVILRARMADDMGEAWESEATFAADMWFYVKFFCDTAGNALGNCH